MPRVLPFLLGLFAMALIGLACNRATDPPPTCPSEAAVDDASAPGATFALQAPAAEPIADQAPATAVAPLVADEAAPAPAPAPDLEVPAIAPPSTEVSPPIPVRHTGHASQPGQASAPAQPSSATATPYHLHTGPALWRNRPPLRC